MNFIYPSAKDLMMTKQLDLLNAPILGVLVTENYVPSTNHASLADIPPACRVAFTGTLEDRSVSRGVFGAQPTTATAVFGDQVKAIVLVNYSGVDLQSPLICYLDQSPSLPVNPNGGDLIFLWEQSSFRIFAI